MLPKATNVTRKAICVVFLRFRISKFSSERKFTPELDAYAQRIDLKPTFVDYKTQFPFFLKNVNFSRIFDVFFGHI